MDLPVGSGKKVLIVDDDSSHVFLLEERLGAAGYQTMAAADGVAGLGLAKRELPDLIITDVLLPKMNGFELTEQLKSSPETGGIPVIMMSSIYVTEEDMLHGFDLGAETYFFKADLAMRKPLEAETLLEAAAMLVEKSGEPVEEAGPSRILVVDDDPDSSHLVLKQLEPEGYALDTAAGGREAMDMILERPYDLVLLDIRLPEVDGLDVLKQVKEIHPGIAVVMMTGFGSEEIAAEALRRGADDYIIKPLEAESVVSAVRAALERVFRKQRLDQIAARLRGAASPELENKERLINELRNSSITLMDHYDRLLAAEEQNRVYSERLEQMVDERAHDLKQRSEELAVLHSVLSAAARTLDLFEVLGVALQELEPALGAASLVAFVVDPQTKRLRMGAQENMPEDFLRWVSRQPGDGEGILKSVLAEGGRKYIEDLSAAKDLAPFFPGATTGGLSMIFFPMNSLTETVGLVAIVRRQEELDEATWSLLDSVGDELGVIVDNIRLYDNLRQAYLSTIMALAEAVDARDSHTMGHSGRVSAFAVAIAEHMGLPGESVLSIRDAGYLHDVGKIGTPDAVLHKEDNLTPEEMITMRRHPGTSHKILEHASIPNEIKLMIKHHHEHFDGAGYPDGLAGNSIPVGARILSVADAFEAMTSGRPYRQAMTREDAIAELRQCSGSQFDPEVVEIFLEVLEAGGETVDVAKGPANSELG